MSASNVTASSRAQWLGLQKLLLVCCPSCNFT